MRDLVGTEPASLAPWFFGCAAIALAWAAGMAIVAALLPRFRPVGTVWLVAGGGYVLGAVLAGTGMAVVARVPALADPGAGAGAAAVALSLGLALGAMVACLVRRQRRHPRPEARAIAPLAPSDLASGNLFVRCLAVLLVAGAALDVAWMLAEVVERPILGWDGWTVWAVKPEVWFRVSPAVRFVAPEAWIAGDDPLLYTVPGHHYPALVGRFQLWIAGASGSWDGSPVFFPWPLLWASLPATFVGLCRLHGLAWAPTLTAATLLAAAPFPAVHGALPGYLDLWVGVEALLAIGFLVHGLEERARGSLVLGSALLVALVGSKLEGLLWALIIALAVALAACPPRTVLRILLAGLAVLLLWALGGGLAWQLGGAEFVLRPDRIVLPYLGSAELAFTNRLGSFVEALFVFPNWHVLAALLFAAAGLLLAGGAWDRLKLATGLYLLFALGFLFLLFNFTPAGEWAEDLTAANRLILHMVPAATLMLALCYGRLARSRTGSAGGGTASAAARDAPPQASPPSAP